MNYLTYYDVSKDCIYGVYVMEPCANDDWRYSVEVYRTSIGSSGFSRKCFLTSEEALSYALLVKYKVLEGLYEL